MKLYFDVLFQDKKVPISDVTEVIDAVAKELTTEHKWLIQTVRDAGVIDATDLAPHQMIHIMPRDMPSLRLTADGVLEERTIPRDIPSRPLEDKND